MGEKREKERAKIRRKIATKMRWSSSAAQALSAAAGLLLLTVTPANAQAYFGTLEAELESCSVEEFVYLGCFADFQRLAGDTWFTFQPLGYDAENPARSWPNWDPGSTYDDTVTPLDCARVCRGFGYKYAAVINTVCKCGAELPTAALATPGICDVECSGDGGQICGGGTSAQIYLDPTFASSAALALLPTFQLASYYRYIGCYSISNPLPTQDPARASPLVTTVDECFGICAELRLPLVFGSQE